MAKKRKKQEEIDEEFNLLIDVVKKMGDLFSEVGLESYEDYKELELTMLDQVVTNVYENMTSLPSIADFNYSFILSEEKGIDNTYEYAKERINKSDKDFKNLLKEMYSHRESGLLKVEEPKGLQDYYNTLCSFCQQYSEMYSFFSNKSKREICNNIAKNLSKSDDVAVDEESIARVKIHLDLIKLTEAVCGQALDAEKKTNSNMPQENFAKTITKLNKRIKGTLAQLISSFKQNFLTDTDKHLSHLDTLTKIYDVLATSCDARMGVIERWAERIMPVEQVEAEEEIVVGSKHADISEKDDKATQAINQANQLFNRIKLDYVRDLQTYIDQTKYHYNNPLGKTLNGLVEDYNKFASTMPLPYTVSESVAKEKTDKMNRWIDRFYDAASASVATDANECSR